MLTSLPAYPYTAEQAVNQVQGGLAMRILIALLMGLFFHGTVGAQGLTRGMSGYAAISGPHAVLWVARDAGLFEKNGLRTEVAYIRSGSTRGQTVGFRGSQRGQTGGGG